MIPDLSCKLPYNRDNLDYIDIDNRLNISGKHLNKVPKELIENDRYILDKLNFYYKTIDELEGDNINGLIDHINIFQIYLDSIKDNDEKLAQEKLNFLKINDCNLDIQDLFPCKEMLPCDIYAYFDNTHINYSEEFENSEYTCKTCNEINDCNTTSSELEN
jgi:hypothetical protein